MNNSAAHSKLVADILVALSRAGVLAWKNHTGMGRTMAGNPIRFGLKGSADILAVLPPRGRFAGIEVKTGTGRQRTQQGKFEKAVQMRGGLYLVARSVEDALALVEEERAR